jgi:hypothetical protein
MNHLHHTNYHASTLGEMQRIIAGLSASIAELKATQCSPISFASLEEALGALKTKVASLAALESRVVGQDSKIISIENRLGFLESREPKMPANLENALQLKLEHYMTKCVKERIDMLNIPLMKVQLEEKIASLAEQVQKPAPPSPPPIAPLPPQSSDSVTDAPTEALSEPADDIDISFIKRRQNNKKPK